MTEPTMTEPTTELFSIPENPVPAGATVSQIETKDGVKLRVARWMPTSPSRGTVALLHGYSEFIEKYFEIVGELLERQFEVVAMDWRGHGLSDRLIGNRLYGHVDDFSLYQHDLVALKADVLAPFCRKPWFALGHSMGGANLLAQAHAGNSPFERVILSAPMVDLFALNNFAARALLEGLDLVGFGGSLVPGGSRTPGALRRFETNLSTSDKARFERTAAILRAAPALAIADPTVGWVHAAARLVHAFADADYPRRILTPVLVIGAGQDGLIPQAATERFATRLKAGGLIMIPYARHEILMERDKYRGQFWAAFDAFIPGHKDSFAERLIAAANTPPSRGTWAFWKKPPKTQPQADSKAISEPEIPAAAEQTNGIDP